MDRNIIRVVHPMPIGSLVKVIIERGLEEEERVFLYAPDGTIDVTDEDARNIFGAALGLTVLEAVKQGVSYYVTDEGTIVFQEHV